MDSAFAWSKEEPSTHVEQLARDAKVLMINAGSNEVQVTHVATGLLRR